MTSLQRLLALAGLAILLVLPHLVGGTYYVFMLIIVFIYSIAATGLNILAGHGGQFSLGHAALMAVGAYTSAIVAQALAGQPFLAATGLHVWIALVIGTGAAAIAGAVLAVPALRVKGPYLAMVTVAFGWVVWKILQEWVSVTGGDLGISSIPKAQIGGFVLETGHFYYVALAFFVAALVLQHRLIASPLGLRIRAVKHSEIGLSSVGVDVYRLKVLMFVISAAFAGCAGGLFALQQSYISPDNFQFFSSVFLLLAVLFGGPGTFLGAAVGIAVLTMLPELLQDFDHYRLIIYGCFILVTLYLLPRGVMGPIEGRLRAPVPAPAATVPARATGPGNGAAVSLDGISLSFGGLKALSDVALAFEPGKVHALIGPNGAGKTSLINVLTGFYQPNAGTIRIDGSPTRLHSLHVSAQHGFARTFQTIKLFGDMSVLEHVIIGLPADVADPAAEADALLAFVGLSAYRGQSASALAYGHRRLLEIARALATRPRLLLLDEPAAGLVQEEIAALATIIREIRGTGVTILLVEHHMDLVMAVSDRVTVLNYGQVIAAGTPAEIQSDRRVVEAYLGPGHVHA
ncbi:branched-chain amino acid ABC transporter ATP-binding protein/permease [Bosea sp. (in: a-proteobacteria)]|uniref:branched-chain amino acid ABC transporter ATP-binding protein/permease n=1 Tax=Bosea sp. (in: a-proteobacteria) TaxID=1871050 RepID=UPI001ACDDCEC|nr:branched-chain amino acid ABC transporter ATP-binding protein/permease [Bosea sp. (in: a-proteobacteria)]MBN9440653.1 branched-chain amino acid ABC transporter ATP-binding protein/permease [Bosea sp. (in: a-proteobacteria)]